MGGKSEAKKNPTGFDKEAFTNTLGSSIQSEFNKGYTPFGKSLYAGQGDTTTGGLRAMLEASNNPSFNQGISGAMGLTSDVAAGNRFGMDDPGYARVRQNAIDEANMAATGRFAAGGTFGSDKHKQAVGEGVANATAALDYGNYQNDIARQERAMANLPALLQASYMPSQTQLQVGQMQDADAQAALLAEQDLFRRQNDADYTNLARTVNLTNGSTVQNATGGEEQPNPFFDILGLGIAGAGAFL